VIYTKGTEVTMRRLWWHYLLLMKWCWNEKKDGH
jgi:hypothetical protein